jgi:uncharacterized Ntn-hydrolase superfamily protein
MTYSIAARDDDGTFGVAVVGAVATQAMTNVAFGPDGLARMRGGATAQEALDAVVAGDEDREDRQVAMVDAAGRAAAFTGSRCLAACGSVTAAGVTCQGNILTNDGTWDAMLRAYQDSSGSLVDRLLAALEAAEAAGGDARGRQSAALIVDDGTTRIDVRTDDHPDPIAELHRLIECHHTTGLFLGAIETLTAGDVPGALAALERAQVAYGRRHDPDAVRAVIYTVMGQTDEAAAILRAAIADQPSMGEYFVRTGVARGGLDEATARAVVAAATQPPVP